MPRLLLVVLVALLAAPASLAGQDTAAAPVPRPPPAEAPRPLWPVEGPDPLPGSILPDNRIVAYYGNPLSRRMGILGELPPDEMLERLDEEVAAWTKADSTTPVQPALHLVTIVAQRDSGADGKYRLLMDSSLIERVYGWAQSRGAILFLDVQLGRSTLQAELPRLRRFLIRPDVHLGVDPEFFMKREGRLPGQHMGSIDASDINFATEYLADLVTEHELPPKVLVIHRFTGPMLTNHRDVKLDARVQIVVHMDGWGPPAQKVSTYRAFIERQPIQFTGFKVFYKHDTRAGHPVMRPADILELFPSPVYIQYQ